MKDNQEISLKREHAVEISKMLDVGIMMVREAVRDSGAPQFQEIYQRSLRAVGLLDTALALLRQPNVETKASEVAVDAPVAKRTQKKVPVVRRKRRTAEQIAKDKQEKAMRDVERATLGLKKPGPAPRAQVAN